MHLWVQGDEIKSFGLLMSPLTFRDLKISYILKVPKREIFDRSDFPDFYTIKSSWVGDVVIKILAYYFNFWESYAHLVSDAHAEHTRKELMRMLSIRISSWCVCSGYASVPDAYAQCTHQFLTRMLSARTSSWLVCSVHASDPDALAQHAHKFLMRMLSIRIKAGAYASGSKFFK